MSESREYLKKTVENGSINISEEVLAVIAAAAAAEVEGVHSLSSNIGAEFVEMFGKKSAAKGVKISVADDGGITVDVFVLIGFGGAITDIARRVQDDVASAIESMSGMSVTAVNVHVTGVSFEK